MRYVNILNETWLLDFEIWVIRLENLTNVRYSKADFGFMNIDSTATSKKIRSGRDCMHIYEVVYKDKLKRLTA